jgi:zinc protease
VSRRPPTARRPRRPAAPAGVVAARRVVLDNGLALIVRPNLATASVAVHLALPAGAAFDPAGLEGLAGLASGVLDRGAGGLGARRIALDFENLGVAFVIRARLDSLDVTARLLSRDLPFVLERLRLIVAEPDFPEDEVAAERARILTDIAEREQDTAAQADDRLAGALFPAGHPYHAPAIGTRASLDRIGRSDLARFHAARMRPPGAVLCIAGGVDAGAAVDLATRTFGGWQPGGPSAVEPAHRSVPDAPAPDGFKVIVHPIAGKTQADLALGFAPVVRRRGEDLQAALVMSSILGEFGMGGRLGLEVREDAGLAYYAHSYVWAGLGAGPVVVRAGVAPANVVRAARLIRTVIAGFLRRGPRPSEIADSRQALTAALPRRFETNPQAAAILADCEYQGLGYDFPDRIPARLAAVDRAAVIEAARRYVTPGCAVLVVTGPDIAPGRLA